MCTNTAEPSRVTYSKQIFSKTMHSITNFKWMAYWRAHGPSETCITYSVWVWIMQNLVTWLVQSRYSGQWHVLWQSQLLLTCRKCHGACLNHQSNLLYKSAYGQRQVVWFCLWGFRRLKCLLAHIFRTKHKFSKNSEVCCQVCFQNVDE